MSAREPKGGSVVKPEADGPGFEAALDQVEQIIRRIEAGEVGLEASIQEYERGVQLIKRCREVLERVEQRVVDLTDQMKSGGGAGGGGGSGGGGGGGGGKKGVGGGGGLTEEAPF